MTRATILAALAIGSLACFRTGGDRRLPAPVPSGPGSFRMAVPGRPAPSPARWLTTDDGGRIKYSFDGRTEQIRGVRISVERDGDHCRTFLNASPGPERTVSFAWNGPCVEPHSWPDATFAPNAPGADAHVSIGALDMDRLDFAWLVDDTEETGLSIVVTKVRRGYAIGKFRARSALFRSPVTSEWPPRGKAVDVSASFKAKVFIGARSAGRMVCQAALTDRDEGRTCWSVPIQPSPEP